MNRLLAIGFRRVGQWRFVGERLTYDIDDHGRLRNVLYAFVTGDQVRYVGKTIQALRTRLLGYCSPGAGQATNLRNHNNIRRLLSDGQAVTILALPDSGLLHYGQFHLNIAAALEDSLIAVIDPDWNCGRRTRENEETQVAELASASRDSGFHIRIGDTYFRNGFFNVPTDHSAQFGEHGQTIELFCGSDVEPVLATLSRSANANGTPRIYGHRALRDWFVHNDLCNKMLHVDVASPNAARLTPPSQ